MDANTSEKKKAWLTYSWKDNEEDQQVNWIIKELEKHDLEVHLDNRDLIPGRRLWDQIAKAISDPAVCDAWIFLVTPASLNSEACREELAYALDRALNVRGEEFPLIGLIDGKFERNDLPGSLKVRLCVSTFDPYWREKVAAGVRGVKPGSLPVDELSPIIIRWHTVMPQHHTTPRSRMARTCLEVRPRVGSWFPFVVAIPISEQDMLVEVRPGPRGQIPVMYQRSIVEMKDNNFFKIVMHNEVSAKTSAYIMLKEKPSVIYIGDSESIFKITP